jgi:Tol biopolymer transport system component
VFKSLFRSLTGTSPVSKIVFQNTGDSVPGIPIGISTMNPDGSQVSKIRSYGSEPAWSPNGKWIAFSGFVDGYKPYAFNIHIMKPDGTDVRQITHHRTGGASSPSWSNDSTTIAYYVFEDGREHQIWIVDVTSGKETQLAINGTSPVWTSSNEIVFEVYAGSHPLMIMDARFREPRECRLFQDGDWSIRWSPEGYKIAFIRDREIYVMESDGGNLKKIKSGPVATGLSWSPDGRQLVFYGSRERQAEKAGKEIYVIDCDGLNERKILANPWSNDRVAELNHVCWSPWLN